MGLKRHSREMECGRDEDDAATGGGIVACVWILRRRREEGGKGCFEGVEGPDGVDVDDGFESIGRECTRRDQRLGLDSRRSTRERLPDGGNKVSCCSRSVLD